ncbi:DKNYY domain-containing protein [uncultured Leptotrichia sp.]|uniref:AAA family ATPase n=1 Tax=uncultured Leptotrichia sp. TaxID=159271 RepID=UPI00262B638B|nr:DKNYY domain-containing protein [uncultured Leptotrichia sp.]
MKKQLLKILMLLFLIGNLTFSEYVVKDGKVFYDGKEVLRADIGSFRILNNKIAVDSQNIYFLGSRTIKSEKNAYDTSEPVYKLSSESGKLKIDKEEYDVKKFKLISSNVKNSNFYFLKYDKKIYVVYGYNHSVFFSEILNVDYETFESVSKNLVKDKNKVYFVNSFTADSHNRYLIDFGNSLFKEVEFIKIEEEGLSEGEKVKLGYFSTLYSILNGEFKNKKYVTLLFDEVETFLHPEWSRRFLYELIEELEKYEDKKFKLIFATHSPFLIADVLAKDCIYLSKNKKGKIKAEIKEDVKTFGANIIDLFKNTMFLESTFGKFATEKIKGLVDKIEKAEKYSDIKHEVDFIIDEIGEKLISNKLKSMIESKFENKDEEKDEEYYRKKIEEYQAKLDELEKKENNRNSKK